MTDRVLVVVPGLGVLALAPDVFREALEAGSTLIRPSDGSHADRTSHCEPLLDADQLSEELTIPVSWLEQKAREGAIPSLEFGRWRRFRRSEVEAAVRESREHQP